MQQHYAPLSIIFLSDMATADGKYLEQNATDPQDCVGQSKYTFPSNEPTSRDWKAWEAFWTSYTEVGKSLYTAFG